MEENSSKDPWVRHEIYDKNCFQWHLELVDDEIELHGKTEPNPAKTSAIFVVHGMGQQRPTETAAALRSGFDDALVKIQKWQAKHNDQTLPKNYIVPPPYIRDGYWGNYTKVDQIFPEQWKRLGSGQQQFIAELWQVRTRSRFGVFWWAIRQLPRLLNPRVGRDLKWSAWIIYLPYQVMGLAALVLSVIKAPLILTGFLGDVRLYLDPKGVTERAIAQRIDTRVADNFMRMIGMDTDFNNLPKNEWNRSSGRAVTFDRVIWVAHSLGSVISYNVLSDLFHKAKVIEDAHSTESTRITQQYENVQKFRRSLRRFVTFGSPLDKVAYLYKRSVTHWPQEMRLTFGGTDKERWWVNFYSVLDPVSGALNSKSLCGTTPPVNLHVGSGWVPGYAHIGYWKDKTVLRYILGRTYGKAMLPDNSPRPWPPWLTLLLAIAFHAFTFFVAALLLIVMAWWIAHFFGWYCGSLWAWILTIVKWLLELIHVKSAA